MLPKLFIRADASTSIGAGHIMRCIALAQAWKDNGGQITFMSQCSNDTLGRRIKYEGFKLIPILNTHPNPDDLAQTLKILTTIRKQQSTTTNWVVLDGYHFDSEYQRRICQSDHMLLVIDDMAHLDYYYADVVLNQNLHAEQLSYSCGPHTSLLLGTKYVLLRREFLKWKDWKRIIPEKAQKILVTLGGSDPDNVTLKVIQALNMLNEPDLEVRVVIGPSNPHHEALEKQSHRAPCGVRLMPSVKDMPTLMAWADAAVSVAGSTCWELAFMGLPALLLVLAENQRSVAENLTASGCALSLGHHMTVGTPELVEALCSIINNRQRLESMSLRGRSLVDGCGSLLAVSTMLEFSEVFSTLGHTMIRPAEQQDAKILWKWANDPIMRANAFHSEPIPLDRHLKWYKRKLNSPDTLIWILENNGLPMGQVRYDRIEPTLAEIDIYVEPKQRGKGFGSRLLEETAFMACQALGVERVRGVVIAKNTASAQAFRKAGFLCHGEEEISGRLCFIFQWHCHNKGVK